MARTLASRQSARPKDAVKIRRLGPEDLAEYRALRLRGLAEHPEAFTSSAEEEAARPPAALASRLAPGPDARHDVVLGAFVDGTLVGIVGLEVDPRRKVRHKAHVFGMYVAREAAGRGIGAALIDAVVAHARSIRGVTQLVLTATAGTPARRFYERAGFRVFGVEPVAVVVGPDCHDKLHMILFLPAGARAA
jgi:GNAT superfamily N-acetyltransferase